MRTQASLDFASNTGKNRIALAPEFDQHSPMLACVAPTPLSFEHSIEVELPVGNCRILDLEALIRAKQAMNRDHDRITVGQLKEIQRRQRQG